MHIFRSFGAEEMLSSLLDRPVSRVQPGPRLGNGCGAGRILDRRAHRHHEGPRPDRRPRRQFDRPDPVRLRGQAMQEAIPAGVGAMAAIVGLEAVANENGSGQLVVAGRP